MRGKALSFIPLALSIVAMAVFLAYFYPEPTRPPVLSFELPYPFAFAHSVFLSVSVLVAAFFFGRGFLATQSVSLLVLGTGSLVLGLGFLLSQVLGNQPFGGPNQLIGISSASFLISGAFYGAFATFDMLRRHSEVGNPRAALVLFYLVGVLAVVGMILVFETNDAPAFFAPGIGPTSLREQVLGLAVVLYAFTSVGLMRNYVGSRNDILYWFSLGLAAVSVGFLAAFFGKVPGGLYSWLGRICLELGGVYIILAIMRAYRGTRHG